MMKKINYLYIVLIVWLCITGVVFAQESPNDATASESANESANESASATDSEWYLDKKISGFEFKGLDTIIKTDMNNVLSEYKGEPFTLEVLSEIQGVLYELDYFEEIVPEAQRGFSDELILVFTVKEKATVSKITFTGNKVVGRSALRSLMAIRKGDIYNDFKANNELAVIRNKYFEQGYPEVFVSYNIRPADNGKNQVILEFVIKESGRIVISDISFQGNEVLRKNKLKRTLVSKRKSIANKGTFSEKVLEADKSRIRDEYFKRGYIDAKVFDIIIEKNEDPKKAGGTLVSLTYIIQEGEFFTFDEITFEGNTIYTSEVLRKLFPLKKGKKMDMTRFQRGYDRMRLKYADKGFIFNAFDYEEVRDTEVGSMAFVITIQELGQSHIENIIIDGNVKTKDYVIARVLGIEEGDVFSASALNYARLNLMGLRYFNSVIPDSRPGSAPGLIDLIFNLEENLSRDIQFGATFGGSSEFPLSLFMTLNQNNLGGRGLRLGFQGTGSPYEQSLSTSFTDPKFLQTPFSFNTNVSFSHQQVNNVPQDILSPLYDADESSVNYDDYTGHFVFGSNKKYNGIDYKAGDPFPGKPSSGEISTYNLVKDSNYYGTSLNSVYNNSLMTYDNYRVSLSVGTGYTYYSPLGRLGTNVNIGPVFNYVYYDKFIYRPADIQVRNNLEQLRIYNVLSWKGFYDGRDLSYRPTKGAYVSQKFDMYGGILFGESHFIRSTSVAEGHVPLLDWKVFENWSWKIILSGQSVFTAVLPQWYYPEGTTYAKNGPSYVQRLDLNGLYNSRGWPRVRNGEATWNNWLELRMPVYETVVWWDQFGEVARLWRDLDDVGNTLDGTQYQYTIGTGFRFVMRQFPIRIYVAKRFSFDEAGEVSWQTGNLSGSDAQAGSGLDLIFTLGLDFF